MPELKSEIPPNGAKADSGKQDKDLKVFLKKVVPAILIRLAAVIPIGIVSCSQVDDKTTNTTGAGGKPEVTVA